MFLVAYNVRLWRSEYLRLCHSERAGPSSTVTGLSLRSPAESPATKHISFTILLGAQ